MCLEQMLKPPSLCEPSAQLSRLISSPGRNIPPRDLLPPRTRASEGRGRSRGQEVVQELDVPQCQGHVFHSLSSSPWEMHFTLSASDGLVLLAGSLALDLACFFDSGAAEFDQPFIKYIRGREAENTPHPLRSTDRPSVVLPA